MLKKRRGVKPIGETFDRRLVSHQAAEAIPSHIKIAHGVVYAFADKINGQVFNYPGLSVSDNSIIPADPGVNPSLTCTALAEYAISRLPPKPGFAEQRV
jgi:choline dehydrogenase-like flavoprotein